MQEKLTWSNMAIAFQFSDADVGSHTARVPTSHTDKRLAGACSGASFTLTNRCSWEQDQSENQTIHNTASTATMQEVRLQHAKQDHNSSSLPTACQHDMHATLHDFQHDSQHLLKVAAETVQQSCQEDWLLQPYIPDLQVALSSCTWQ